MTVSMQLTKRIYAGNGVTRQWDVDFPFSGKQDLRLFITSPAGAEEEVTEFFDLNSQGTALTYPTEASGRAPLASGWSLTVVRQTPLTQEVDLLRQGELDAEVLESGYDKLTLIVQELNEKISRSIKYPVSSQESDLETDNFLKNILDAKQATLTASSSALAAAAEASQSAQSAQELANGAAAAIAAAKSSAQQAITSQGETERQQLQSYVTLAQEEAQTARYYAERTIGKTVGEVYLSQSASALDNPGALPLFTGETIVSADTLYPDFYAWLQTHPELACTGDAYTAALAEYGECAKYVLSEGSLRLPLLKNFVKMANAQSGITQSKAGLPNITGQAGCFFSSEQNNSGALTRTSAGNLYGNDGSGRWNADHLIMNASLSSSVYGASDTVTPAHTTLYPWVCAFNAAVPASTAQAAQFQQALSGKADIGLANVAANLDFVVESYSDEAGNWYRKYKSGWVEQGGLKSVPEINTTTTTSLLKAFSNPNYIVLITNNPNSVNWATHADAQVTEKTVSSFKISANISNNNKMNWYACGQGAENV